MKRRRKSIVKFEECDQSATTTAEFSFSLTRVAVSQICRSVGYKATDTSAINTLTLITTKFLQSLAGLAASFSNNANRTEVNLFDIVSALQDISSSTSDCVPGASSVSHCLIKSAALNNLSDFVTNALEIPFAKPFPRPEIDGSSGGDLTRTSHATQSLKVNPVPAWLPSFPDASLYLENCTKDRSDYLWENSDSVTGRDTLPESSKSEISGGILPKKRPRVRFKVERRDLSNGCGSCTINTRLDRWRDNNDGESGREFKRKKKNREDYKKVPVFADVEWPV